MKPSESKHFVPELIETAIAVGVWRPLIAWACEDMRFENGRWCLDDVYVEVLRREIQHKTEGER